MNLSQITTTKFIFDPKDKDFERKMIERSDIFDLKWRRKEWLTYIALCFDLNSELRRNIREDNQRKIKSAIAAGFSMDNNKFDKRVEDTLIGLDEDFNRAVIEYIYYNFSNDYKLLYVLKESYDYAIREQGKGLSIISDKERKNLTETKNQIEQLEKVLFGGNETINLKRNLYEGLENSGLRIRREDEMKEWEKNGLDPCNPFPGYKVDKLKFVGDKVPRL